MSDTEKENRMMDNRDKSNESVEKPNTLGNRQSLNLSDSQDFHLVDFDDDESQTESEKLKPVEESLPLKSTNTPMQETLNPVEITSDNAISEAAEKSKDMENENEPKGESLRIPVDDKTVGDSCQTEDKKRLSDEEDDIIECTPPQIFSPSKKQVLGTTDAIKRKAESLDEPPHKIARTLSGENAFSSEKRKLEEEEEESRCMLKCDDSQEDFAKNCSDGKVIIAESQDIIENEAVEDIFADATKDEDHGKDDKHLDSCITKMDQNKKENFVKKDYEIDKNENLHDTSMLSQTIVDKDHTEKTSDTENVVQLADNNTTLHHAKETDSITTFKSSNDDRLKSDGDSNDKEDQTNSEKDLHVETIDNATVHNNQNSTIDKENGLESVGNTNLDLKSKHVEANDVPSDCQPNTIAAAKTRMSVEVIFDRTTAIHETKSKPTELVEIDEDGEKIVLDSSQEDSDLKTGSKSILDNTKAETTYKSCYESKSSSDFSYKSIENTKESSVVSSTTDSRLVNGTTESKKCDTDSTTSIQSDTFSDIPVALERADINIPTSIHNTSKQIKATTSVSKDENMDLLSVSENEPDVSITDDGKNKSDIAHRSSPTKSVQIEKEVGIYVKMKCLLHVDEGTKELLNKEVMSVQCETFTEQTSTRYKTNDTSASMADISGNDNKEGSPGSVNSNPQMFQLNPSRLSFASTVSSLSSASSAASLAAKLAIRDSHFSLPRAPAKHAKKHAHELPLSTDKQTIDEAYERLTKEWQNSRLLTTTVLNYANAELSSTDACNISTERLDDQLQKIRSSTPEVHQNLMQTATPKSTKKGKAVKRPRSKSVKSENQSNGKISPKVLIPAETNSTPNRKKIKTENIADTLSTVNVSKPVVHEVMGDELIGKEVFAKWSDNNYYPGTVTDKVKMKYKVNFYDGKSKVLIEDFVIPIPKTLSEGLSVYATTKADDYGSCGIIVDIQATNNDVLYTVETDEGEKLKVQVKDIFLSSDQAQVLKEEANTDTNNLPTTPKHLGQVTLDNMIDGKRRSRRIATPIFSTPKSKLGLQTPTSKDITEPSVSGMSSKLKKETRAPSDSEGISSDSSLSVKEEMALSGVQPEVIGTPNEQIVKGPQSRIKSKSRSKKRVDDEETIATLGPIPPVDSTLFKGISFILTFASLETLDKYQTESKDYTSDPGTENEEEWVKKPFVRDRLTAQILAGGGKLYTDFDQIPQEEYKNTKLITNVPNTTAKTLLCLSVGIPAYNHNWIIRCCHENKIVSPAEDELPAGWSIEKQSYVEMFQRPDNKPLTQVVVIIPVVESEKQFIAFWRQICENAGAVVLLAENPDAMEGFVEGTVVVANKRCPSWAIERANELQIPLLSTTWIIQCLVEGKLCPHYSHPRYKI